MLSRNLPVNRLWSLSSWGLKSYLWIFDYMEGWHPHPWVIQEPPVFVCVCVCVHFQHSEKSLKCVYDRVWLQLHGRRGSWGLSKQEPWWFPVWERHEVWNRDAQGGQGENGGPDRHVRTWWLTGWWERRTGSTRGRDEGGMKEGAEAFSLNN